MRRAHFQNDCRARTNSALRSPDRIGVKSAATPAFSLIEIVVALAVISIGLIAVVGLIPQGLQASRDAADNTIAATLLHDELNEIREGALVNWPPTLLGGSGDLKLYSDALGTNTTTTLMPDTHFYIHVFLPPGVAAVATSNSLTIVGTVSWPALSPSPSSITNVTTIARYQN